MYLLTINLYELGQFLRIVLWIFLPMVILSMLVTTWLHYRRKEREQGGLLLAIEGFGRLTDGEPEEADVTGAAGLTGTTKSTADAEAADLAAREEWNEGNENIYRGILWMKEKYEQYRDMADKRYEQLREELGRLKTGTDRELISKQVIIDDLEVQLRVERLKVEELVIKLQNNSQLLLNIYQELDKSFSGMPVPAATSVVAAAMSGPAVAATPVPAATPIPAVTQP